MEKSTADMTAVQDKERETVKAEAKKAAERLKDGKRALDNAVGRLVEKLKSARQPDMKRDVREVRRSLALNKKEASHLEQAIVINEEAVLSGENRGFIQNPDFQVYDGEVYFEAKPDKRDKNERIEEKTGNREKSSEKEERNRYLERKERRLRAYQRLMRMRAKRDEKQRMIRERAKRIHDLRKMESLRRGSLIKSGIREQGREVRRGNRETINRAARDVVHEAAPQVSGSQKQSLANRLLLMLKGKRQVTN